MKTVKNAIYIILIALTCIIGLLPSPALATERYDWTKDYYFPDDQEYIPIQTLKFNYSSSINMKVGETIQLNYSVSPSNQTQGYLFDYDYDWEDSNGSPITITQSGTVTAKSPGWATIWLAGKRYANISGENSAETAGIAVYVTDTKKASRFNVTPNTVTVVKKGDSFNLKIDTDIPNVKLWIDPEYGSYSDAGDLKGMLTNNGTTVTVAKDISQYPEGAYLGRVSIMPENEYFLQRYCDVYKGKAPTSTPTPDTDPAHTNIPSYQPTEESTISMTLVPRQQTVIDIPIGEGHIAYYPVEESSNFVYSFGYTHDDSGALQAAKLYITAAGIGSESLDIRYTTEGQGTDYWRTIEITTVPVFQKEPTSEDSVYLIGETLRMEPTHGVFGEEFYWIYDDAFVTCSLDDEGAAFTMRADGETEIKYYIDAQCVYTLKLHIGPKENVVPTTTGPEENAASKLFPILITAVVVLALGGYVTYYLLSERKLERREREKSD